jgi:hypothetical protein
MTFCSGDIDYTSWYAALTIHNDAGAVTWRWINYASQRTSVFDEVAEALTSTYEDVFIPYHAEYMHESDITNVFDEYFPERTKPGKGWDHWDLIPLLKDLEVEARQEIRECEANILDTRWHWLISVMSDSIEPESYGFVLIEGTVPEFTHKLLEYHVANLSRYNLKEVSAWEARLIGELYILASLTPGGWNGGRTAAYKLFVEVVDRYNREYDSR